MKTYICLLCGWIYDIPPNWRCPDCGACKADFEMVEVSLA